MGGPAQVRTRCCPMNGCQRKALFFEREVVPTMILAHTEMPSLAAHMSGSRSTDRADPTEPVKAADAATTRILAALKELREERPDRGRVGSIKAAEQNAATVGTDPRVAMAIAMLEKSGFVISHHSVQGSVYLRWPGRVELLRVADHRSRKPRGSKVVSSLTFGPHVRHKSERAVRRFIARAVGEYFLEGSSP